MAKQKTQPTAEEVIRQHLGGRIITREMRAEMLRMQIYPAWLTSWNRKERKIVFGCCGKAITDKGRLSSKGRQAMREAQHREQGRCPYCGKQVRWLDCNKVRYDDIEEHWHVFYRRSRKDENTLIALGVWCGIKTHHMKKKDREAREEWAKRIQPEFEPCEMILLPWAGVPRRWEREPLNKWSSWYGRYVPTWCGHDVWERVRTIAMHSQGMGRTWLCTDHESGLPTGQDGGRWGKMLDWCMENRRERWLGQGGVLTLCAISRHPQLEYMTKGGLEPLAVAILRGAGAEVIHVRAKNPAKLLPMLDSNELARLKRLPPQMVTVAGLRLVETIKQAGQRAKMEDALQEAKRASLMLEEWGAWDVVQEWGKHFGVMRLVRYFTRQSEVCGYGTSRLWADYMRELAELDEMCESRMFPKNLREAHTETSRRLKLIATERCAEAVKARAEELKKRFAFEACGVKMEPFESPAEIVTEGARLGICIGSYVESYAQGHTILLKMRKKNDPGTPWHAVEFEKTGRQVVQCRGYANATWPEDVPLVEAFWAAWNKAKGQKQDVRIIVNHQTRRKAQ